MKKEKRKYFIRCFYLRSLLCQYYDEFSEECGYHGCPVTKEMKENCDVEKGGGRNEREK